MKTLVEHYLTYGNQDSETLFESCIIEDSKQERQGLLEDIVFDYCFDPEDFINGKVIASIIVEMVEIGTNQLVVI